MHAIMFLILFVLGLAGVGALNAADALHPVVGVGDWIWAERMEDRQECRFVRVFEIPDGARVESALLRVTADNSYRVFLDGRPIGQGGDWRVLIEYDVTRLLEAGRHVLAVSAVNDYDIAGLLAGLRIRLAGGGVIEIPSDTSWRVAPGDLDTWMDPIRRRETAWERARISAPFDGNARPQVYHAAMLQPEPITLWQRRWFQWSLVGLGLGGLAAGFVLSSRLVLKSQAERIVRRERARIAGDLHDNLGGGLTHLVMLGEAARREQAARAVTPAGEDKLERVCDQARELVREMNETVWLINSQRDTVQDLASYLTRHAEAFFRDTPVRCRFEIDSDLPAAACDLGVRRNLFLAVKEVLNNILRHAQADEVELRIEWRREELRVAIQDNGRGFDPGEEYAGNGLRNLPLRAREAGGSFVVRSAPGQGSLFEFRVPITSRSRLRWGRWLRTFRSRG